MTNKLPAALPLVDSHAHLDFGAFVEDFDDVLARARLAGVEHIVTIGASGDLSANERALALADRYDWISATVGVHPHAARIANDAAFESLRRWLDDRPAVAVGETGLDYFYDRSPRDVQRRAFARFVRLAREVARPIVVHTRDAEADTLAILEGEGADEVGGVIHCFAGTEALAEGALALGFHLSFSGLLTFGWADAIREVARVAPRDRLLVETDAPYLAPSPRRNHRNEPAYVNYTLRRLALVRDEPPEELAQTTSDNARRLFGLE